MSERPIRCLQPVTDEEWEHACAGSTLSPSEKQEQINEQVERHLALFEKVLKEWQTSEWFWCDCDRCQQNENHYGYYVPRPTEDPLL